MGRIRSALLGVLLLSSSLAGQSPSLVKDINPFWAFSNRNIEMADAGGTMYLTGYDLSTGWELWKSDGTPGGTQLVKDIFPGPGSTNFWGLTPLGDAVCFFCFPPGQNLGLWRTDGTPDGTFPLVQFPGLLERPVDLTVSGNLLFFWPRLDATGYEPWSSDGTPGGTYLIKDINPGPAPSLLFAEQPVEHRGLVYFKADDGVHGKRFWKSDGSPEGTVMVEDLVPGLDDSYSLVKWDDHLYCCARDGRLWKTDGRPAGTSFRGDITTEGLDGSAYFLAELNGLYLFSIYKTGIGQTLWKSDGTAAGTSLLSQVNWPLNPRLFRGMIYFSGSGDLWRTDG